MTGLQMVGHIYQTSIMLLWSRCILRFIYGKNKDKTPLRMRNDGFADGGTHISNHNHAAMVQMYITLHLRQKNKDKRHCACVLTGLQMVGHIYQTTSMLRQSTFISRNTVLIFNTKKRLIYALFTPKTTLPFPFTIFILNIH